MVTEISRIENCFSANLSHTHSNAAKKMGSEKSCEYRALLYWPLMFFPGYYVLPSNLFHKAFPSVAT